MSIFLSWPNTYEWNSKSPYVQKLAQMTFLGLLRCKQIFSLQKSTKFLMPQKESLLGVKNYHFWEMTPGYPTLWIWCREIIETSKTCKMLLYFALFWSFKYLCPIYVRTVANMSTFSISAQYVRMSLKESLMYKSSRKWLCWVYLDTNKHFSPQKSTKLFRTPTKFFLGVKNYLFWEMTPAYPTWWIWYRKKLKLHAEYS